MEFKRIKVTAVNVDIKKSITLTIDIKDIAKCKTQDAVKKAIENKILETKVFKKAELANLKYQGRKEVLEEWKAVRPIVAKEEGEPEEGIPQKNYDLDRFLSAQEIAYEIALEEISEGRKRSHWIWYIFPQQKGLGHSYNSEYYGLDGADEARAYLAHPILGERLREMCEALLQHASKRDIDYIMGSGIDVLKLQTSMNLFNRISPGDIFEKVLDAFF